MSDIDPPTDGSPSNTQPPDGTCVSGELLALLLGQLGQADVRRVASHLRTCDACRSELVDASVAAGGLAALVRGHALGGSQEGFPDDDQPGELEQPLPPLVVGRRERAVAVVKSRPLALLGRAAVVLALVGIGFGLAAGVLAPSVPARAPTEHGAIVAAAALRPIDAPKSATGQVTMLGRRGVRVVDVRTTRLPSPPPNHFYEVWLLDPKTDKMLPMGVLSPSGSGRFAMPSDLAAGYSAVDISLQANNGDPAHSKTSELRAYL